MTGEFACVGDEHFLLFLPFIRRKTSQKDVRVYILGYTMQPAPSPDVIDEQIPIFYKNTHK